MNRVINIELESQLILTKAELPEGMLDQIRSYLTLPNPKYVEAEKHERSTWGILIFCTPTTRMKIICTPIEGMWGI